MVQVLDVNQPKVSSLMGYKLEGFSVERTDRIVPTAVRQTKVACENAEPLPRFIEA